MQEKAPQESTLKFKYSYGMIESSGDMQELTKEFVDKLWEKCVSWKIGEPYTIDLSPMQNEKAAELLRARGFIVVRSRPVTFGGSLQGLPSHRDSGLPPLLSYPPIA
jgi:hypothetical protein